MKTPVFTGASLVNKTGFYLIDDTGVIAVETTADVLATLKIGYEVVLEADRGFNNKDGAQYGQTCLKNATVVVNNYGSHAYSTKAFKGDISVADFYNLDINTDYTTSVFTMKATVVVDAFGSTTSEREEEKVEKSGRLSSRPPCNPKISRLLLATAEAACSAWSLSWCPAPR